MRIVASWRSANPLPVRVVCCWMISSWPHTTITDQRTSSSVLRICIRRRAPFTYLILKPRFPTGAFCLQTSLREVVRRTDIGPVDSACAVGSRSGDYTKINRENIPHCLTFAQFYFFQHAQRSLHSFGPYYWLRP